MGKTPHEGMVQVDEPVLSSEQGGGGARRDPHLAVAVLDVPIDRLGRDVEPACDLLVGAARTVQATGPLSLPKLMEAAEPSLMTDLTAEAILTFAMMTLETDL